MSNDIKNKLDEYHRLTIAKKKIDKSIKEIKAEIIENCFTPQTADTEGTETVEIAGCVIKRVSRLTRTLTNDNNKLQAAIRDLAGLSNDVIKWKPSLAVGAYKKMDSKHKHIVDEILTVKIAEPTLTVEGDFS